MVPLDKPDCTHDASCGWDAIAASFILDRSPHVGLSVTAAWANQLPAGCSLLDLGCGFGAPVSELLVRRGIAVHGIDGSTTLVQEFSRRLPSVPVRCEDARLSDFFGKSFHAVLAIGLLFLLPEADQKHLIRKVAGILHTGGRFLFTSPEQACQWTDMLTGQKSCSPGKEAYLEVFYDCGLVLEAQHRDEGDNHYFDTVKI